MNWEVGNHRRHGQYSRRADRVQAYTTIKYPEHFSSLKVKASV